MKLKVPESHENIKVRLFKDAYMNGFRFEFLTSNSYDLGNITGDYLSTFWDKATKKQAKKYNV